MFGNDMRITLEENEVLLKQFSLDQLLAYLPEFNRYQTRRYLGRMIPVTDEDEKEWYKKVTTERDIRIWGIALASEPDTILGTTSIDEWGNAPWLCTSGIAIIASVHGRKIGTAAHIGRTVYALDWWYKKAIYSEVNIENIPSWAILLKVGYQITGYHPDRLFAAGRNESVFDLVWSQEHKVDQLMLVRALGRCVPPNIFAALQERLTKKVFTLEEMRQMVTLL